MPESVKLPAKAQIVLLAGDVGQIARGDRHRALLLEILRRFEARAVADRVETAGPVQGAVRLDSDQAWRFYEPVTNLLRSEQLLGLDGIQAPPSIHHESRCRREHRGPGNGVAGILVPFF